MDDFFAANGAKHLLIYYENTKEVDTGKTVDVHIRYVTILVKVVESRLKVQRRFGSLMALKKHSRGLGSSSLGQSVKPSLPVI